MDRIDLPQDRDRRWALVQGKRGNEILGPITCGGSS
jgi:hypothetical protein